jgi:rRNA maturation protein Nop10
VNSEKYGKYKRKVNRIVKKYANDGTNVSIILKRFGKYRRNVS